MSTIKALISQLQAINKHLETVNKPLSRAVVIAHNETMVRVYSRGIKSNNTPIGKYNTTTPIYVNPKDSPVKFTPRGKPPKGRKLGNTKFKSGEPHKSKYFKSYNAYRAAIDRQTPDINLKLRQVLFQDNAAGLVKINANRYQSGVKTIENGKKARGLERMFGIIWPLTDKEEKDLFRNLTKFTLELYK